MTRRLFHLTAECWWELIDLDGEIVSLAEKVRRDPRFPAPPYNSKFPHWEQRVDELVWLTTNPTARQEWQADQPKGAVRIELRVEDARPWKHYARDEGFPPEYLRLLARSGGNHGEWYVVERPIPRAEWVVVERTTTGQILFDSLEAVPA